MDLDDEELKATKLLNNRMKKYKLSMESLFNEKEKYKRSERKQLDKKLENKYKGKER